MSRIPDLEGKNVAYGQTLGVQDEVRTKGKHVHLEMDTRYQRQFENYVADLVEGRLKLEPELREGTRPRPVLDDGTLRLGESGTRVRDVQEHLNGLGYVGADGQPLVADGVYRLTMQRAVLDYQREQCRRARRNRSTRPCRAFRRPDYLMRRCRIRSAVDRRIVHARH
jgi:hypothetical protein